MESIIRNMLEVNKNQLLVVGAAGYSKESESFEVWHKRLGHAPLSKLRHITNISLPVQENKMCVICPMAKLTRQPFQSSLSKSQNMCELIHTHIWGPYRVPTYRKFRYFLTLIDDCTRTTWVYLLKQKSQALSTFQ